MSLLRVETVMSWKKTRLVLSLKVGQKYANVSSEGPMTTIMSAQLFNVAVLQVNLLY